MKIFLALLKWALTGLAAIWIIETILILYFLTKAWVEGRKDDLI